MRRSNGPAVTGGEIPVTRRARLVLWPLIAVALVHTLFIGLWVGPSTPVKEAIGADVVRSYVMPVFDQNWRIFAPTPRRAAVELDVRAMVRDAETGEERISDWVPLVDGEDSLIRGNPFPPRLSLAARRVANHLNTRMGDMSAGQRTQAEASYFTTPIAELRERLLAVDDDGAAGASTVDGYLRYDSVATSLATYFAVATWSEETTHVQYRSSIRYTPSFNDRHERDIDDAERTYREYGWRPAAAVTAETAALFESYPNAIREGLE
ncbi:DUF5819 family protein [Georgenia sp. MJ170]|uniref:DUF5819 family protein n=1 Tax=Georgenia sunbinii TaxID=3117728 RepID=UPI002F260DA0